MQTITIVDFIEQLKEDGVILYLSEGKIRTRGPAEAVDKWRASMRVRKDELLEYLTAQETKYVDPINKYDAEEGDDGVDRKPGTWNTEDAWSYYHYFHEMIQSRKRRSAKATPLPSEEIAHLGRMINIACAEKNRERFRRAVDRWFDANLEMLDQNEQGIWKGPTIWAKHSEAVKLYARNLQLIEYAYATMPEEERPRRNHPEILKIEEEIAECFRTQDFERLQDACFKLTKKWRDLGLTVRFK